MSPSQADRERYLRLPWPTGRNSNVIYLIIGLEADILRDYAETGSSRRVARKYGISAPNVTMIVRAMEGSVKGLGGRNNPEGRRRKST